MNKYRYNGNPVIVSRDAGYSKIELLSEENIKQSRERIENPDIVTGRYKLKELLEEVGIVVNTEAMTFWYAYSK